MPRFLTLIKLAHTLIWAFFVGCIAAIPIASSLGHFKSAAVLAGVVFLEVLVLAFNAWRCPLTDVAARHTDARQANFDIFLPQWLARYNKEIFGTWYVGGCVVALTQWLLA